MASPSRCPNHHAIGSQDALANEEIATLRSVRILGKTGCVHSSSLTTRRSTILIIMVINWVGPCSGMTNQLIAVSSIFLCIFGNKIWCIMLPLNTVSLEIVDS